MTTTQLEMGGGGGGGSHRFVKTQEPPSCIQACFVPLPPATPTEMITVQCIYLCTVECSPKASQYHYVHPLHTTRIMMNLCGIIGLVANSLQLLRTIGCDSCFWSSQPFPIAVR
jgi:hypothetical protein